VGWAVGVDFGFLGPGLTSPLPVTDPAQEIVHVTYGAIRGELRWNLVDHGRRGGLAATLGAGFELRGWDQQDRDLDRDLLTRIFGRLGFDLVL
jgi:hypothetical protein